MRLYIGHLTVNLLNLDPDYATLTDSQAETYRLMLAIASIRGDAPSKISLQTMVDLHKFSSPLPLLSRLRNLQKKGFCSICGDELRLAA